MNPRIKPNPTDHVPLPTTPQRQPKSKPEKEWLIDKERLMEEMAMEKAHEELVLSLKHAEERDRRL